MNRRQDRSLWAQVDGAIVNSGVARLCRACLAVRHQSMEDPAFTCRIWGFAVRLWVAFFAMLRALVAPARQRASAPSAGEAGAGDRQYFPAHPSVWLGFRVSG